MPAKAFTPPAHDLHVHTVHCGHAAPDATVANAVARAARVGLEVIGFAEHVVFPEHVSDVERVREDVRRLAPAGVRVLTGVEMDPDPIKADGSWVADPGTVDFVLLSLHRLPGAGTGHWAFNPSSASDAERARLGQAWLNWLEACVRRPGVHVLAHPFREPIRLRLLTLAESRTADRAYAIARLAAQRGIAFELNEGWMAEVGNRPDGAPYLEMVRALADDGMRFSCGSDAHQAADVGRRTHIARVAERAGLRPHAWLEADALEGG